MSATRLFITVAATAACALATAQAEITFSVIAMGTYSSMPKSGVVVMQTPAQYTAYQKRAGGVGWFRKAPVNFKQRQLVAIHMGPYSGGGQGIQLRRMRRIGPNKVEAQVVITRPRSTGEDGGGAMFRSSKSKPYVLVSTPRFKGTVVIRVLGG